MKTKHQLLILTVLLAGACSSKKPEKKPIIYPSNSPEVSTTNPKETSIIAKQVATEQGSNFVTEVKYKKGQSQLSKVDQQKIREQYQKAQAQGKVEEVQLITWADKELTPKKDKLDEKQQDLVDQRNETLEKFIDGLDSNVEVKKISMAERAGAMAKFTQAEEAKVKESLKTTDAPGKASESMVIFLLNK